MQVKLKVENLELFNIIILMKILDLENVDKYFSVANKPYYKIQHFEGNINIINGIALNSINNETEPFRLKLNEDHSINFRIGDSEEVIP